MKGHIYQAVLNLILITWLILMSFHVSRIEKQVKLLASIVYEQAKKDGTIIATPELEKTFKIK